MGSRIPRVWSACCVDLHHGCPYHLIHHYDERSDRPLDVLYRILGHSTSDQHLFDAAEEATGDVILVFWL
jgi:hypothetical protein